MFALRNVMRKPSIDNKSLFIVILALGALGYAASSVGFGDLISVVYPVFGYCSSVFIVCLLVHAAQTRKKEYKFFENSGTKEEEISS